MQQVPPIPCPICKEDKTNYEECRRQGFYVCVDCGCVLGDVIDSGPEWRNFDDAPSQSRVGPAYDPRFTDGDLGSSSRCRMRRDVADARKRRYFDNCERLTNELSLTKRVLDRACNLLCEQQTREEKNRHTVPLCAAAVFLACRSEFAPRTMSEICLATRPQSITKRQLGKALCHLRRALTPRCDCKMRSIDFVCQEPATHTWWFSSHENGRVCRNHARAPWVPEACADSIRPITDSTLLQIGTVDVPMLCERICALVGVRTFSKIQQVKRAVQAVRGVRAPPLFVDADVGERFVVRNETTVERCADGTIIRAIVYGGRLPPAGSESVLERFEDGVGHFDNFNMRNRGVVCSHEPETLVRACVYALLTTGPKDVMDSRMQFLCNEGTVTRSTIVNAFKNVCCVPVARRELNLSDDAVIAYLRHN